MRYPTLHAFALLLALALALSGCGQHDATSGAARFNVQMGDARLSDQVARVKLTLSASDIPPLTVDLGRSGTSWVGSINGIKAGSNRAFHADAYAADNTTILFTGDSTPVTIVAGQTAAVTLLLQQVSPTPVYTGSAPVIDSLVLSSNDVSPGTVVNVTASAHDPDPQQQLTYTWSAATGAFNPATGSTTQWTAPAQPGAATLTLTVTNQRGFGASVSVGVTIEVLSGQGAAQITVTLNNWPVISALTPTAGKLSPGQGLTLAATASDADGDTITYAWSADCAGGFNSTSLATVTFTLPAQSAATVCTFALAITDGRGGSNHGTLQILVSTPTTVDIAPAIDTVVQSLRTIVAPGAVQLQVFAHSPQQHALTYTWSTAAGALGPQVDSGTGSANSWTFTSCGNTTATASVLISDGLGGTATAAFNLTEQCP